MSWTGRLQLPSLPPPRTAFGEISSFPTASNAPRHRGGAMLVPPVESEPVHKVSAAQLLAALDSEIEEENRGPAGSSG